MTHLSLWFYGADGGTILHLDPPSSPSLLSLIISGFPHTQFVPTSLLLPASSSGQILANQEGSISGSTFQEGISNAPRQYQTQPIAYIAMLWFCQGQMYPAAEGRFPTILNRLRHIGIWVQFMTPKVLTWSHLLRTGYSKRLMWTLSSLTLETFYGIGRPLSSTSQCSISTFMSILLGRALNSYLKFSSSVHCIAHSDSASNPRWISVKNIFLRSMLACI